MLVRDVDVHCMQKQNSGNRRNHMYSTPFKYVRNAPQVLASRFSSFSLTMRFVRSHNFTTAKKHCCNCIEILHVIAYASICVQLGTPNQLL